MKVNRNWLLAIASLVWFIAGFNILRIGVQAYKHSVYLSNVILSVLVFSIFYIFIFSRLVKKHTIRIRALESEKQYFWNFFDKSSFLIMAFMMIGGNFIKVFRCCTYFVYCCVLYWTRCCVNNGRNNVWC